MKSKSLVLKRNTYLTLVFNEVSLFNRTLLCFVLTGILVHLVPFDTNLKVTGDNDNIVIIVSRLYINSLNLLMGAFKSSTELGHTERIKC